MTEAERQASEREFWGSISLEERIEYLMRFSSFHFGLLGLVSDALHERMRIACRMTPK